MSTKLYIATFCHDPTIKNSATIWPPIMILSNSSSCSEIASLLFVTTNEHNVYQEIMHNPDKKLYLKNIVLSSGISELDQHLIKEAFFRLIKQAAPL